MKISSTFIKLIIPSMMILGFSLAAVAAPDDDYQESNQVFPDPQRVEFVDEYRPHMGVLGGFAVPTQSGYNNAANYGIDVGYQPFIPFGLALELSRTSSDMALATGATETSSRTKAMVRGTYNFGGSIPVLKSSYLGLGAGPVFASIGDNSYTKLGIMPHIGFDIPVERHFTLGLAANVLVIPGDEANSWGANGAVKYWF